MSNFRIGEKVVCIDDSIPLRPDMSFDIKKGEIYTIIGMYLCDLGDLCFHLKEVKSEYCQILKKEIGYSAHRFRKLDYAHTERICAEIIESLKIEEVQLN